MFKYYLTYNMTLSFAQTCRSAGLPTQLQHQLTRSSENLVHHFATALYAKESKDEARHFYVAITCLRDCKEILESAVGSDWKDLKSQFDVLHPRLEAICLSKAQAEGGQLRMLG